MKILIIDNDQDNLISLKALIKDAFPDVLTFTASNGKKGLELAASEDPDVILLDIVMPGMDGFEVCKKLKSDKILGDIPVIFITALKGDKESRVSALECGADAFLSKPVDEVELIAQVRAMAKIKTDNLRKRNEKEHLAALVEEKIRELQENHDANLNLMEDLRKENETRRKSEEMLQILSSRQEAILSAVPEIIMEVNCHKIYTWANRMGIEFFGDDVIGKEARFYFEGEQNTYCNVQPLFDGAAEVISVESWQWRKDGEKRLLDWRCRVLKDEKGKVTGTISAATDITERKLDERRRTLTTEILETINKSPALPDMFNSILSAIRKNTGFEAVGIRLKNGDDFSYYVHAGFSDDFLLTENTLAERDKSGGICMDKDGKPCLQGTCGLVISGKTDPANPLFTPNGSFWTNNSLPLLDLPVDQDPRLHPRNRCFRDGYASVALIPIRANKEIVGLLQLNNRKKNSLSLNMVRSFERICSSIGIALMQKQAETELRNSEIRMRAITDSAQDAVIMMDPKGLISYWNPASETILGYPKEEAIGKNLHNLLVPERYLKAHHAALPEFVRTGRGNAIGKTVELEARRKDGREIAVALSLSSVLLNGEWHAVGIIRDITGQRLAQEEKANLELQLRESHKMDAVGQLAGGISHDFNNLLSIINGYAQILLIDPDLKAETRMNLKEMLRSGERAASLTRQLLLFSRRQIEEPKIIDLDSIISEMEKMLRRIIRENIIVRRNIGPALWNIKADPGNIEQVIMNLVINASDAMPDGGTLTIETGNIDIDETNRVSHHPEIKLGHYVMLSVTDTGCGMDAKVMEHIFEPFFTTKEIGKGTGLGLATVYGIIKQSNAHINVQSELGKGTKFWIYFPQSGNEGPADEMQQAKAGIPRGAETILLVDDEDIVRNMLENFLGSIGYTVISVCNGEEALKIAENHKKPIHVLLTDIVMPGMNGFELAKKIKASLPEIKLLYMSGYNKPTDTNQMTGTNKNFINKPICIYTIANKLREILEGGN